MEDTSQNSWLTSGWWQRSCATIQQSNFVGSWAVRGVWIEKRRFCSVGHLIFGVNLCKNHFLTWSLDNWWYNPFCEVIFFSDTGYLHLYLTSVWVFICTRFITTYNCFSSLSKAPLVFLSNYGGSRWRIRLSVQRWANSLNFLKTYLIIECIDITRVFPIDKCFSGLESGLLDPLRRPLGDCQTCS